MCHFIFIFFVYSFFPLCHLQTLKEPKVSLCKWTSYLYIRNFTSSISVAEVGKPPDVAQAHSIAHAGEDKLNLVAPVPSPGVFILLHWLAWNCSVLQQRGDGGERERGGGEFRWQESKCVFEIMLLQQVQRLHLAHWNTLLSTTQGRDAGVKEESILKGWISAFWPKLVLNPGVHQVLFRLWHAWMVDEEDCTYTTFTLTVIEYFLLITISSTIKCSIRWKRWSRRDVKWNQRLKSSR